MAKVKILSDYCKSCKLCVETCPKKVLATGDKANKKGYYAAVAVNEKDCIGCGLCGMICPDLAVEIYK